MFLVIQNPTTTENIPFETILKISKHNKIDKYILTLSEIESKLDLIASRVIKNKVIEVALATAPDSYNQIETYLLTRQG